MSPLDPQSALATHDNDPLAPEALPSADRRTVRQRLGRVSGQTGDLDPSQRVSADQQIERVRSRLHGAKAAQGAEDGLPRRARSASRKGRRVPQVFRDGSNGSGPEKDKTAD